MKTTMIRSKVKYEKVSPDDGYIDAQVCSSVSINTHIEPFRLISTPPLMDEVPENLTPKKQKIKVPTQNTPQIQGKFFTPTQKKGPFCTVSLLSLIHI